MPKLTFTNLFLYFLIPIQLLIFSFLVPPFQKPDEQAHFEKSLLISKGYLFCNKKINNTVKLEKKYIDFIKTPYLDLITHGKNTKLPTALFLKDLFSKNQNNKIVSFNIDHLCSFPLISYLPQAITLKVLSIININPIQSIYIVRLVMGILSYLWFLYLFRSIAGSYKLILLFTFALPMTLHQISSFSYDAPHVMLALTFFTLIVNNLEASFPRKWESRPNYLILFFILLLFLGSKKIGYETFFLFLFLIPFEIKPIVVSILIFTPFYFLSKLSGLNDLQSSFSNQIISPYKQIDFLMANPINIIKVITVTTIQRFRFYLQSLIGIFGWLEYGLNPLSYSIYGSFFIYVLININLIKKQILSKSKNILLFMTLIVSYIFIVLLTFIFNTVPGTLTAHGVQGRYFIPFLPFIILFFLQFTQKITFLQNIKINYFIKNAIYFLVTIYLILATFYSVFNRYYQ